MFGRVLIIKSLGISPLVYSASNVDVPAGLEDNVKRRLFQFLWKNKRDRIKRTELYQDYGNGGLRMLDFETMVKALRLAWIPRPLKPGFSNWKTVPDFFFRKCGGLNFLLTCNYNVKFLENLPKFYKDILSFFSELKVLYGRNLTDETILFNNQEILIGGKPFVNREWLRKGICSIRHLLDNDGNFLDFACFREKYLLTNTNFLQYYQVVSAVPKRLLIKSRTAEVSRAEYNYIEPNLSSFLLADKVCIDLTKMKASDFYWLLIAKTYTEKQTGQKRWDKTVQTDENSWTSIFKSVETNCKDMKLREFQFKFLHRTVVTRKKLLRFGIKADGECLYCGDLHSIDHTFIHCHFTKLFSDKVVQWFNDTNGSRLAPSIEAILFGNLNNPTSLSKKFNYTLLFMRYYIYKRKLNEEALLLQDFINRVNHKYVLEKLTV